MVADTDGNVDMGAEVSQVPLSKDFDINEIMQGLQGLTL